KKTVIDMAGYEEEGNIDKFLDDLYETAKYLSEHREKLDNQVLLEEMVRTAEELERKSKCTKQVCEEVSGLIAQEDPKLDHMRGFYKRRLDELMDKERQVPIERYEALRREQSVVTERHIISDVDPYTKKKIRTPLRNVRKALSMHP
uniref:E3 SUMO-protein ligase NSE2 n=1 Tax=Parascaris univalens TaxID=6257 RepID=A0A915CHA6_PARUN